MNNNVGDFLESNLAHPAVPPLGAIRAREDSKWFDDGCVSSRIVVIDDEVAVTKIVCKVLNDFGFDNTLSFNDPEPALESILNDGADVILLDLKFPKLDGITILKFLRSEARTRFVPVIVLTSSQDEASRIEALTAGANDYLTKPVNSDELIQRMKNAIYFKKYADRIEQQVVSVERELRIDSLTKLNNRRAFDEQFAFAVQDSELQKLSLLLFDVDQFKLSNDNYGHDAGDHVLEHVATVTKEACSEFDFAARIGGDEFAVISRHEDPDYPAQLAEKIRSQLFDLPVYHGQVQIRTTVSIGIATMAKELDEKGALFKAADAALYQSKRQGRNTINVYSNASATSIGHRHLTNIPSLDEMRGDLNDPRNGHILIIDDEPAISQTIKLTLSKSGYKNVSCENDASKAFANVQRNMPDLILLDIHMPVINGLEILRLLKEHKPTSNIPVLIMTSSNDERIRVASLKLQATDFLTKPTKPVELDARVFNSLKLKMQRDQLIASSERLTHEVEVRTSELFSTRRETILCLARAAETRDTETGNHVIRVGHYAAVVARKMGMSADYIGWIELAAQLHDVGKLSIPDAILHKPGKLTSDERKVIETHCEMADRIFFGRSHEKAIITSPLLKMAARIASTHHEKWDGTGYPNGLAGTDIPIEGRITAVADVFDALSTKRHYKEAIQTDECFQMIQESSGTHFDPDVVDAFVAAKDEILQAMLKWKDRQIEIDGQGDDPPTRRLLP